MMCSEDGMCCMAEDNNTDLKRNEVQEYYGSEIKNSSDLKTNCCTTGDVTFTKKQKNVLSKIHEDIITKFYGCGSPIPPLEKGATVVDLGCGTGRDSYVASAFVGEEGKVIGIDMTDSQLETANKFRDYHAQQFGFSKPNCEFKKGIIEDLKSIDIKDESVDVVISNCVINLSPNKQQVLKEVHRILKTGGELYFSDVFADRRIPIELQKDKVLWGECLSGALYIEDFRRLMQQIGFNDFRVVSSSKITIENQEIEKRVGSISFYSQTIRAFKLNLEDRCEDYGQEITYLGTLDDFPSEFILDSGHKFEKGKSVAVCKNTADMISLTRFAKYFKVSSPKEHRGLFDCAPIGTTGGSCC